jgi:hypothetical protein
MAIGSLDEKVEPMVLQRAVQNQLSEVQGKLEKTKSFLGTLVSISEKNAELVRKLDAARDELAQALLGTTIKCKQAFGQPYREWLHGEVEQLKAEPPEGEPDEEQGERKPK